MYIFFVTDAINFADRLNTSMSRPMLEMASLKNERRLVCYANTTGNKILKQIENLTPLVCVSSFVSEKHMCMLC